MASLTTFEEIDYRIGCNACKMKALIHLYNLRMFDDNGEEVFLVECKHGSPSAEVLASVDTIEKAMWTMKHIHYRWNFGREHQRTYYMSSGVISGLISSSDMDLPQERKEEIAHAVIASKKALLASKEELHRLQEALFCLQPLLASAEAVETLEPGKAVISCASCAIGSKGKPLVVACAKESESEV